MKFGAKRQRKIEQAVVLSLEQQQQWLPLATIGGSSYAPMWGQHEVEGHS